MITKVDSPNETASSRVVYDQIVLGAGTSGLTYLYYAARSGQMDGVNTPAVKSKTLVIGEQDLWQSFNDAGLSDAGPGGEPNHSGPAQKLAQGGEPAGAGERTNSVHESQ